jgi:hypothetical protein
MIVICGYWCCYMTISDCYLWLLVLLYDYIWLLLYGYWVAIGVVGVVIIGSICGILYIGLWWF